tara:strand:- start:421 stop:747 length:327 start_codon:yes stop_codon:yes gene_type:complete
MKVLVLAFALLLGACSNSALTVGLQKDSAYAMTKTFQSVLENNKSGITGTWYNNQTKTSGTVTVISTYYKHNRPCREFVATIHGTKSSVNRYGDACRYGHNDWRLIYF